MAEVYGAVQDRILVNLAKHFPYLPDGAEPDGSFVYQSKMLAQMGQVNRETVQIIRDSLDGADDALKNSIAAAILDALKTVDPELEAAAKQGLLPGGSSAPPPVTANMSQAFQSYYRQSADHLNLVNTVMLESTQQAYSTTVADIANRISGIQRGLNVGTGEAVSGVSSYNQAIRHAVDRMVAEGITGFIDHGGRRWKAETYAAMDIKTTMFNTARAAIWERQEQYGNDLYQVSSHMGARPLCYPYQGKVISRTDSARVVTDLDGNQIQVIPQSQTSYGQAAGLFGINCKHYPMPFIPGFSTIKDRNRQDEEENAETYENLQTQRGLERKIREQKRDLAVLKAQKATDAEIKAARERVKRTSEEIDTFCEEKGLPRRRNREGTPINSTWPAKETYDAAIFDTDTRDRVNAFFEGGGSQVRYGVGTITGFQPVQPAQSLQPVQNVASQATTQTYNSDMFNGVGGLKKDAQSAMAQKLLASGNNEAISIYGKYANELKVYNPRMKKSAYFSPVNGGIAVNVTNAVNGSNYEEPLQVLFHEFGHNVDWLAGGKDNMVYLSNKEVNGVRLQTAIKSDFDAFKQSMGALTNKDLIDMLKAEGMDLKTRGNISDILEYCTGTSYPLGIGHGAGYHKRPRATEKEFFAEVLDSSVANQEAYKQMQRLFPNAVNMVWEMIRGVI